MKLRDYLTLSEKEYFMNERFGEVNVRFTLVDWFGKNLVKNLVPMHLIKPFLKDNRNLDVRAKRWWDMNGLGKGKRNALDFEGDFNKIEDALNFIKKYDLQKGNNTIPIKGKETANKAADVHIRQIWFSKDGEEFNGFGFYKKYGEK